MTTFQFPDGFIWGTATAAHQVEGNNTNSDIWLMEHTTHSMFAEPSLQACDHYNRYRDDIKLLADLGFNSYRFSIEWARIEPDEGDFSNEMLDHYADMLACCHENGLKPFVTLHHFTSPQWLLRKGGWEGRDTPELFARYAQRIAETMGDDIAGICTINEANIGRVLTSSGMLPSLDKLQATSGWQEAANALQLKPEQFMPFMFAISDQGKTTVMNAHRLAVAAIKAVKPDLPCGLTLAVQDIVPGPGGEALAAQHRQDVNEVYLEELTHDDFVGVQCYTRHRYDAIGPMGPEAGVELTDMGYEFWPEALESSIRQAHATTGIPVLVTENGVATDNDERRIEFVERALSGVQKCLQDGLPVIGYTYWSAMDNYEWMLGYRPRFGLISIDRTTQGRTLKPSAQWLGAIARANVMTV